MPLEILIADDSIAVRKAVRSYLIERNFDVCGEAIDGEDAIEKTREFKPALILLDLAMPRANGVIVASVLRDVAPNIRIVLFTMYADEFGEKLASAIGVQVVLSKPEGLSKLGEHLKALLNPDEPSTRSGFASEAI